MFPGGTVRATLADIGTARRDRRANAMYAGAMVRATLAVVGRDRRNGRANVKNPDAMVRGTPAGTDPTWRELRASETPPIPNADTEFGADRLFLSNGSRNPC